MCVCSKCGCESMIQSGKPEIRSWGFGANRSDTNTIMYFEIRVPYECSECGFKDFEFITATEEEEC